MTATPTPEMADDRPLFIIGSVRSGTTLTRDLLRRVPDFICLKAASTNENTFLKVLRLPEGGIAIFDKGFNKYRCFDQWTEQNRFFVTRLKENAHYEVLEENNIEPFPDVLKDQHILLKYKDKRVSRTVTLRLITYCDPVSGEILRFLTNMMGHTAMTITLIYKNRWVIEVLFYAKHIVMQSGTLRGFVNQMVTSFS